jgi:hypothetical protein
VRWAENYHLFVLGALSLTSATVARAALRQRWRNWISLHIIGMGLSYVLMLTAISSVVFPFRAISTSPLEISEIAGFAPHAWDRFRDAGQSATMTGRATTKGREVLSLTKTSDSSFAPGIFFSDLWPWTVSVAPHMCTGAHMKIHAESRGLT